MRALPSNCMGVSGLIVRLGPGLYFLYARLGAVVAMHLCVACILPYCVCASALRDALTNSLSHVWKGYFNSR